MPCKGSAMTIGRRRMHGGPSTPQVWLGSKSARCFVCQSSGAFGRSPNTPAVCKGTHTGERDRPPTGKSTQTVTPGRATPHAPTSPGAHRQPPCVADNLSLFGPVGGGENHGLVGREVQNLDRTAAGLRHADSTACWLAVPTDLCHTPLA